MWYLTCCIYCHKLSHAGWNLGCERSAGGSQSFIVSLCSSFPVHVIITTLAVWLRPFRGQGLCQPRAVDSTHNIWRSLIKELLHLLLLLNSHIIKIIFKKRFPQTAICFIIGPSKVHTLLPRPSILCICDSIRFLIGNLSKIIQNILDCCFRWKKCVLH